MNDFIRDFLKDEPELLHRYERNEARYILQLPEDYDTLNIELGIEKEQMARFVRALAELDLSLDEWILFKLKEVILSEKLSENEKTPAHNSDCNGYQNML